MGSILNGNTAQPYQLSVSEYQLKWSQAIAITSFGRPCARDGNRHRVAVRRHGRPWILPIRFLRGHNVDQDGNTPATA